MEFKSNIPIYLQVIRDIERRIVLGDIPIGSKLPSSRELALQYQINPNTAARVYNDMEQMGLSYTKRGIGTFVTEDENVIDMVKKNLVQSIFEDFDEQIRGLGFIPEMAMKMLEEFYNNRNNE